MKKIIFLLSFISLSVIHLNAHVAMVYPSGGESFTPGQSITIEWEEVVSHNTLNYDLMYSIDGGSTWQVIQNNLSSSVFSYVWEIPNEMTSEARVMVTQDNDGTDYSGSSNDFSIGSATEVKSLSELKLNVYPNPVSDFTILEIQSELNQNFSLSIYDTVGKLVRYIPNIREKETIIYKNDLKKGIYMYSLKTDYGRIASGKIIFE